MSSDTSGAAFAGDVTTLFGETLSVYVTENGGALLYGNRGTAVVLHADAVDALRELLDRAAMPGQVA